MIPAELVIGPIKQRIYWSIDPFVDSFYLKFYFVPLLEYFDFETYLSTSETVIK